MRSLTSDLHNLLASGRAGWFADLWTITLVNGTVVRWSGSDIDLRWGGNTYVRGPGLLRSRVTWKVGLEADDQSDQLKMDVFPRPADTVGGVSLAKALSRGDFDGATVQLQRAVGAEKGSIVGVIPGYFVGRVGPIDVEDFAFELTVYGPTYDLDQPFPRNVVMAQCGNRLFDDLCGIAASAHRVTGAVTGGVSTGNQYFTTGLGQAAGHFTLGRFRWTSGANAGRSQSVRVHDTGAVLRFARPWPEAVHVGDAFEVWPGCDKRQATCSSKFSNIVHFRGMPFVPAAETTA